MASQPDEMERPEIIDKRRARLAAEEAAEQAASGSEEQSAEQPVTAGQSVAPDAELAAEREKADTYYKNWQRSAADFINYKRRVEQEKQESARLSNAALAINILPVFDDLDRAVGTVDANLAGLNWVQGVVAIHRKFSQLLDAMGVREIETAGQAFDPARHEAIGQQPGPDGQVIHVVQKGYTLADKVIRPAMVIVGNGQQNENTAG